LIWERHFAEEPVISEVVASSKAPTYLFLSIVLDKLDKIFYYIDRRFVYIK
jgi:hypothetical protein